MTIAEVRLWGTTIGAVEVNEREPIAIFQYDRQFVQSGIEVSPIVMPLKNSPYRFPALANSTFNGLPGLLADSLPDKYGNAVIDAWLASQGREATSFNAIERLCYTGDRGMGALEFRPATGPVTGSEPIDIAQLVKLASEILSRRGSLVGSFNDGERAETLASILAVGTSAGGARAKAVIAWNPITNEVRSGQTNSDPAFTQWLLKFDGVESNRDRELNDPSGFGAIEYAYSLMAVAAGVTMTECRLLEEHGRRHFMTRRFDRNDDGSKLHMQSLAALAHFDFNQAGAHSYEQAMLAIRQLRTPMSDIEQQFRRMIFNVITRNHDDHVKNIAFLMDKTGRWSLSPAYDVAFSYNPAGTWTNVHQMSVNGKREGFTIDDFRECARTAGMKRGRAETITEQVRTAASRWIEFAAEADVSEAWTTHIGGLMRLELGR